MAAKKTTAKKSTAKKVPAKAAKKATTKKAGAGAGIEAALKLMQRKDGATREDLNKADFRRPAMSAIHVAKNRGLKFKVVKKEGARTVYHVATE